MLYIGPRNAAPQDLLAAAPAAQAALLGMLAQGFKKLNFRSYVYGSDIVRAQLDVFHHGKCAFCETSIKPVATPQVEHFRPKAGYVDELTRTLEQPGYYWLAYEWDNLMLACPRCNSKTYKGNRFPLALEHSRALAPDEDLALEDPLLIDPSTEDPRELIRFRGPVAYAVGGARRGRTTIEVLGLNREDLIDAREAHLEMFFAVIEAVPQLPVGSKRSKLETWVAYWLSVRGPYRSCLIDAMAEVG